MKLSSRVTLASLFLALLSSASAQLANYVETVPITIRWNFNITGISGTTLGPKPVAVSANGIEDPDSLRPVDRITTENGRVITFSENGTQQFFVTKLIENEITQLKLQLEPLNEALAETTDEAAIAAIEAQIEPIQDEIDYLSENLTGRWELTGVREPQTSVAGVASTPYAIFLTRIDAVAAGRPGRTLLTNLQLTPLASVRNTTETLSGGRAVAASGKVVTHFSIGFASQSDETTTWLAHATGYMKYSVRITRGAVLADRAVLPTKVTATGTGSWVKVLEDNSFGGTGPIKILIGEPKIQARALFPEFDTL